jgi:predicted outer membrane repeat protein
MKKIQLLLTVALLLGALTNSAANVVWVTEPTQTAVAAAIAAATSGDTVKFNTSTWGENRTILFTANQATAIDKNLVIDGENNNIILSGNKQKPILRSSTNNLVISISNLTFKDGKQSTGGGAAISFSSRNSIVTFTNVRFIDNEVPANNGGAITTTSSGITITVNNCYFSGNKTSHGGGAIYTGIGSTPTLIVSNSIFENNSSSNVTDDFGGGAIQGLNITVTGSVFKNNTSRKSGGAIYSRSTSTVLAVKLLGNTFIENSNDNAATGGGALGVNGIAGSNVVLAGNVFQDNTSGNGAVNNEFYSANTNFAIASAGYNVFKGAAIPAAEVWTSAATDVASANDIVNAEGRISDTSAAFEIIPEGAALIEGLSFPVTDLFGNHSTAPYNAGADQTNKVTLADITADQPTVYPHNEEKSIGTVLVDAPALSFSSIGFSVPAGIAFTAASATLKDGSVFSLSDVALSDGDNGVNTRLQLTVNFAPTGEQEYRDTLTVSAAGAYDYVIPLHGTGIAWTIAPTALQAFSRTLPGSVSAEQTVTVTGSSAAGAFAYSLKNGQSEIFPVTEAEGYSATTGGELAIRFAPATFGTDYRDTLVVASTGSERTFELPLTGRSSLQPVITTDSTFYRFVETVRGKTVVGGKIEVTLTNPQSHLTDEGVFTFARAEEYAAAQDSTFKIAHRTLEGGTSTSYIVEVTLSFTPPDSGEFLDTLIIRAAYAEEYRIPLSGAGFTPVVTSDPAAIDFGRILAGQSKDSTLTVTLTDPAAPLTESDFSLAGSATAGVYVIESIVIDSEPLALTLTFSPTTAQEYLDTLIVRAAYADEYRIPLSGAGFTPVVTSDPTALNFGEVNIGQSKDSTVTVTLTDPVAPLTAADFTLAGTSAAGIFSIASVATETEPAVVTLTFSPQAKAEYLDTLIVRAAHAAEHRIPLSGTGIGGVAIPVTKAAAATFVSVRDRNIVVSQAPVGSLIRVYNLHGKALKTQAVTSSVETLKTASLPKSVYIVVVNNDNQEILRKKVVL